MFEARAKTSSSALPRRNSMLWAVIAVFYVLAPLFHQFGEIADVNLHAITVVSHSHDGPGGDGVIPAHSKACNAASHCQLPAVLVAGFSGIDASRQHQLFMTNLLPDRLFLSFPAPPPKSA